MYYLLKHLGVFETYASFTFPYTHYLFGFLRRLGAYPRLDVLGDIFLITNASSACGSSPLTSPFIRLVVSHGVPSRQSPRSFDPYFVCTCFQSSTTLGHVERENVSKIQFDQILLRQLTVEWLGPTVFPSLVRNPVCTSMGKIVGLTARESTLLSTSMSEILCTLKTNIPFDLCIMATG